MAKLVKRADGGLDILITAGDREEWELELFDEDDEDPVDITGAIVRLHVKENRTDTDAEAILRRRSYDSAEAEITDPINGVTTFRADPGTTRGLLPTDGKRDVFFWDAEYTRQGATISQTGSPTIDVTSGSDVMVGTGLDLSEVKAGDVVVPGGSTGPNQIPVVIVEVEGTAGAGNLRTDYTGWDDESAVPVTLKEGEVDTPRRFRGDFIVDADVTR